MTFLQDESKRAWLYRIALALLTLAVALKLIPVDLSDEVENVLSAIVAISGIGSAGLATGNTSTKALPPPPPPE